MANKWVLKVYSSFTFMFIMYITTYPAYHFHSISTVDYCIVSSYAHSHHVCLGKKTGFLVPSQLCENVM